MKAVPKENAGYEIKIIIPHSEHSNVSYVLAESTTTYVTWLFNHSDGGFYDGHYFSGIDIRYAIADLLDRSR